MTTDETAIADAVKEPVQSIKLRKDDWIDDFIRMFPTTSNKELSEFFGVSKGVIAGRISHLGLRKSKEYISKIHVKMQTGIKRSQKTKDAIAAKATGRKMSQATKTKIIETRTKNNSQLRGDKHPAWKGGRPWQRFAEIGYIAWRNSVLVRDDYTCRHCGRKCNKKEKGLAAHHIFPYATHPDLRLDLDNGITLCRTCHMTEHGRAPQEHSKIPCACGCSLMIAPYDRYGRPRQYVNGHANRGVEKSDSTREKIRIAHTGKVLSEEHKTKIGNGCSLNGKWARHYDNCVVCGTTARRHTSKGMCDRCCQRDGKPLLIKTWSLHYDSCQGCGTTSRKYSGHGMCSACYQRHKKAPQQGFMRGL